jgi:hypothetical protein
MRHYEKKEHLQIVDYQLFIEAIIIWNCVCRVQNLIILRDQNITSET